MKPNYENYKRIFAAHSNKINNTILEIQLKSQSKCIRR